MPKMLALREAHEPSPLRSLLLSRRTTRSFSDASLTVSEISGALWACAGTAGEHRVCPSARAIYPIAATLIVGRVNDLAPGAYCYEPSGHSLQAGLAGDHRRAIAETTLDADWLAECPMLLLLSADLGAASLRFPDQPPERGERFVWMEAGHAAQNVYLWAAEHYLGTALIAGLDNAHADRVCQLLLPPEHQLLSVIGIGHIAP